MRKEAIPEMKPATLRLPINLYEDLRQISFITRKSKNSLIIAAVEQMVGAWKAEQDLIREKAA